MVQVPPETNVTVDPVTVHTEFVCELKLTVRVEVAVALTVKADAPYTLSGNVRNVI